MGLREFDKIDVFAHAFTWLLRMAMARDSQSSCAVPFGQPRRPDSAGKRGSLVSSKNCSIWRVNTARLISVVLKNLYDRVCPKELADNQLLRRKHGWYYWTGDLIVAERNSVCSPKRIYEIRKQTAERNSVCSPKLIYEIRKRAGSSHETY